MKLNNSCLYEMCVKYYFSFSYFLLDDLAIGRFGIYSGDDGENLKMIISQNNNKRILSRCVIEMLLTVNVKTSIRIWKKGESDIE